MLEEKQVNLAIKMSGADQAIQKAKVLCDSIKEAKSLADDLTSLLGDIKLEVEV